ncbi:hypothetical protein, partial [Stieleria sp.]|uniref:hypothetical protein n=1 Tax=Stieleria sp. TaxID=2795976 RepID=UPI003566E775
MRNRRRNKAARLARKRISQRLIPSPFEKLEDRHLLATVQWDGGGDGTRWHDPLNWDSDALPTAFDDVTIEDSSNDLIVRIDADTNVASILSSEQLHLVGAELKTTSLVVDELIVDDATLRPPEQSSLAATIADRLTIDAAAGQFLILGNLHVQGDLLLRSSMTLVADGTDANLRVDGDVNLDQASLTASAGGVISMPSAERYRHQSTANNQSRQFLATGTGSRLELGGLRSLTGATHYNSGSLFQVADGGVIDLSSVQAVIDPVEGDTRRRSFSFVAKDAGSQIDLSALATVTDQNADQRTSFSATDDASIQIASLTDARGTQFLLDGSGSLAVTQLQTLIDSQLILRDNDLTLSQLASANRSEFDIAGAQLALPLIDSLRDGAITVGSGGVFDSPQLTNIDGTDLHVRDGATLSLPGVTGYRHLGDASSIDRTWSASGVDSRLELPNLSSILGGWGYNNDHVIQADD